MSLCLPMMVKHLGQMAELELVSGRFGSRVLPLPREDQGERLDSGGTNFPCTGMGWGHGFHFPRAPLKFLPVGQSPLA